VRHFDNSFFLREVLTSVGSAGSLEGNSLPLAANLAVSATNAQDLDRAFLLSHNVSDLALLVFES